MPIRDSIDALGFALFVAVFLGGPLLGWLAMVADYRAYLRSLRRALVVARQYWTESPLWAIRQRPECLQELDLQPGCSREEVMAAYRRKVKTAHPDQGGDRRRFDRLQRMLAEALALVEAEEAAPAAG